MLYRTKKQVICRYTGCITRMISQDAHLWALQKIERLDLIRHMDVMLAFLALCLWLVVSSVVNYYHASTTHATFTFLNIISGHMSMHIVQLWSMVLLCD